MSIESAKAFIERLNSDKEFVQNFIKYKDHTDRIAFVKLAGFDFTYAELKQATGELSDDDLDTVSGGHSTIDWVESFAM